MRENCLSGLEGGARFNASFLPLSMPNWSAEFIPQNPLFKWGAWVIRSA